MPRNTCRWWSMYPRTRPAVVRTTGPAPAACVSGEMQALEATAFSRSRRLKAELRFRIGQRPVLNQLRPRGRIDASHATHSEAMPAAVEHMQLATHAGGA